MLSELTSHEMCGGPAFYSAIAISISSRSVFFFLQRKRFPFCIHTAHVQLYKECNLNIWIDNAYHTKCISCLDRFHSQSYCQLNFDIFLFTFVLVVFSFPSWIIICKCRSFHFSNAVFHTLAIRFVCPHVCVLSFEVHNRRLTRS